MDKIKFFEGLIKKLKENTQTYSKSELKENIKEEYHNIIDNSSSNEVALFTIIKDMGGKIKELEDNQTDDTEIEYFIEKISNKCDIASKSTSLLKNNLEDFVCDSIINEFERTLEDKFEDLIDGLKEEIIKLLNRETY